MSDKHSFNSYIRNNRTFNSFIKNVHSFNSYIRNKHSFNLIIEGFQSIFSWRIKLIIPNHIVIVASKIKLLQKIRSSITIKNIMNVDMDLFSSIQRFIYNIDVRTITIVSTMKMLQRIVGTIVTVPQKIELRMKLRNRIFGTEILAPAITFEIDMSSRKYYLLSYWDSSLLSDLDSTLLIDMDYAVI